MDRFSAVLSPGVFGERFFVPLSDQGISIRICTDVPATAWLLPTTLWIQLQLRGAPGGLSLFAAPDDLTEALDRLASCRANGREIEIDHTPAVAESWVLVVRSDAPCEVTGWIELPWRRGSVSWWGAIGPQAMLALAIAALALVPPGC